MDDILVFSKTHEYHVEHIEWVLHALKDARLKVALEKSEFILSEISFLGYIVTVDGLKPDPRKVAAIQEAPAPVTLTQVRAFLGLASYYRRFIKGFASIAKPLMNLLKKEEQLIWTLEWEAVFQALKEALTSAPVLARPDLTRPFAPYTYWQPQAISAVLTQHGADGREQVIEYASKTLSQAQANYEACKGECLAVCSRCQAVKSHEQCVRYRSEKTWVCPNSRTDQVPTEKRYLDARTADGFAPSVRRAEVWTDLLLLRRLSGDSLSELANAERRRVTERAQDYRWQGPTLQKRKVDDDGGSSWLTVPHPLARFDWTRAAHEEDADHFAVKYTEKAIEKNGWYWSGIREDVKYIVQNCPACVVDKAPVQMPRTMVPTRVERPFQRVSIDTTDINVPRGPIDQGELNVLLVAVDHFSKWIEACPMTSRNSQEVAWYVNRFLCMHLDVEEVHMDNGSEFQGKLPPADEDASELHRALYSSVVLGMFTFFVEHEVHNVGEFLHVYYVIAKPKPERKEGTMALYPFGRIGTNRPGLLQLIHIELLSIAQVIAAEEEDLQLRLRTASAPCRVYNAAVIPDYLAREGEFVVDFGHEDKPLRPPSSYPKPAALKAPRKRTVGPVEEVVQPAPVREVDPSWTRAHDNQVLDGAECERQVRCEGESLELGNPVLTEQRVLMELVKLVHRLQVRRLHLESLVPGVSQLLPSELGVQFRHCYAVASQDVVHPCLTCTTRSMVQARMSIVVRDMVHVEPERKLAPPRDRFRLGLISKNWNVIQFGWAPRGCSRGRHSGSSLDLRVQLQVRCLLRRPEILMHTLNVVDVILQDLNAGGKVGRPSSCYSSWLFLQRLQPCKHLVHRLLQVKDFLLLHSAGGHEVVGDLRNGGQPFVSFRGLVCKCHRHPMCGLIADHGLPREQSFPLA
ncbi:hypothetical protein CBR_g53962 [Chara braunii]|uniref:Integrase catalytic domain-containing protein n=1 Tax=Chara braunii TaxID=69332 RepID=A0A388MBL6_CHABU|nr:hypothetical protein CBR_g53962 [Chara braunii]|eukprot:GBG91903.1 hypothetical protein CBR_g53962 [Chara braunii]